MGISALINFGGNNMETKDLKIVLDALHNSIDEENKELYKKIIQSSKIKQFNDYDEFFYMILYPFQKFIEGLIKTEIADNNDVVFLYRNSQFVERQFQKLIETKEGSACCVDKSGTIMKRLVKFYTTGEKIEFDYNAKYTYHLPKNIFNNHESIIDFYKAVKQLFYGNNITYLKEIGIWRNWQAQGCNPVKVRLLLSLL